MTVLAVRTEADSAWIYNPDADTKLSPGSTIVVLGSAEQVSKLRDATAG